MKSRVKKKLNIMSNKRALLSVYEKSGEFNKLVAALVSKDYELIASGGTYMHIKDKLGFTVTNVSQITGVEPVLDHRVVTLAEEIHGGLLADEILHLQELEKLGWPFINIAVCTFYPLEETIRRVNEKYKCLTSPDDLKKKWDEINNMVDIGGPTIIRSACKGGRVVLAAEENFKYLIDRLGQSSITLRDNLLFRADAARVVADYVEIEAKFRNDWLASVR